MTGITKVSRRVMLRLSLLLAGAGATARVSRGSGGTTSGSAVPGGALAPRLAATLGSRKSAAAIGFAALDLALDAAEVEQFVHRLGNRERLLKMDARLLRQTVQERHLEDLQQENLVEVRGWLLSRTEASLCVLAALVSRNPGSGG